MQGLEHTPYHSAINEQGVSYITWRKHLKLKYKIVWRDLALGYLALAILLIISTLIQLRPLLLFIAAHFVLSICMGLVLAYLALFLHEAGHFNLHPNKKTNDRLTTFILGYIYGVDIKSYRKIHWQHHLHLGTPSGTEVSYHHAITPRFIAEILTGVYLLKILHQKTKAALLTSQMQRNSRNMVLASALINFTIVILFSVIGQLHWHGAQH